MIVAANTLNYLVKNMEHGMSLSDFIIGCFSGTIEYSYWYLYAYIGFLLMLPYLRKMISNFETKDFIYCMVLHFIFSSLIPMIKYVLGSSYDIYFALSGDLKVPLIVEKAFFYPILGYYVDKVWNIRKTKFNDLVWILVGASAGIIISSVFTYCEGVRGEFTQNFVQLFDYVTTICVYVIIKYLFVVKKLPIIYERIVLWVGPLTLGMYLFDPILKHYVYLHFNNLFEPIFPTLIVSFGWCIFSMVFGGVITYGIKKLPVMNHLI